MAIGGFVDTEIESITTVRELFGFEGETLSSVSVVHEAESITVIRTAEER